MFLSIHFEGGLVNIMDVCNLGWTFCTVNFFIDLYFMLISYCDNLDIRHHVVWPCGSEIVEVCFEIGLVSFSGIDNLGHNNRNSSGACLCNGWKKRFTQFPGGLFSEVQLHWCIAVNQKHWLYCQTLTIDLEAFGGEQALQTQKQGFGI